MALLHPEPVPLCHSPKIMNVRQQEGSGTPHSASDAALRTTDSRLMVSRFTWCAVVFASFVLLLGPALWNRFPLLQYDTGGYLARWFEGYLVPSRPGAYGLLLTAAAPLGFWPVLILQAAAAVWILLLVLRQLGLRDRPYLFLTIVVGLSVGTTLPWLASILLTDIFAGLAVLALYLLGFGTTLHAWERRGLVALVAFAAATHTATLALVVVLIIAAFVTALFRSRIPAVIRLRHLGLTLVFGVALTLTANWIVSGRFAFTPGGYGILFGRMLQDGIVSRYLADHCPDKSLQLCPYREQLPLNADAFLWGEGVFNRLGRFAGLGEEMRTIVLESLRDYPRLQLETAIAATIEQLTKFSTGEGVVNSIWHTYGIMEHYTPGLLPAMRAARQQRGELDFRTINLLHVPVALLSATFLLIVVAGGGNRWELEGLRMLAATVGLAILANAFVCGALSNPHDRYGARLIWMTPLILMLFAALLRTRSSLSSRHSAAIGSIAGPVAMQDASTT